MIDMVKDIKNMNTDELIELSKSLYDDLNNELGEQRSNLVLLMEVERELTTREE
jgi:hypothetical protein